MALDFLGVARVLINSAHNCRQQPDEGQLDAIEVSIPAFCGSGLPGLDSANLTDGVAKRSSLLPVTKHFQLLSNSAFARVFSIRIFFSANHLERQ